MVQDAVSKSETNQRFFLDGLFCIMAISFQTGVRPSHVESYIVTLLSHLVRLFATATSSTVVVSVQLADGECAAEQRRHQLLSSATFFV